MKHLTFGIAVLFLALSTSAFALPSIGIDASIKKDGDTHSTLKGRITIEALDNSKSSKGQCIYLPLNDPSSDHFKKVSQQLKLLRHKTSITKGSRAVTAISSSSHELIQLSEAVYKTKGPLVSKMVLEFETRLTHLNDPNTLVFDDALPVPLSTCPDTNDRFTRYPELNYHGNIKGLESDSFSTISLLDSDPSKPKLLPRLSIALIKNYSKTLYDINGLTVYLYLKDDSLDILKPTIKSSISSLIQWLGPLRWGSLHIIEADQLESFLMPGIVAINKPRQTLFETLQTEWLNWSHWAMSSLLAYQFFIPQIQTSDKNDLWFFQGLIDFLTAEILSAHSYRSNLFNVFDLDFSILSMTYKDSQNFTAALLERYSPFATLTDSHLDTIESFESQHPLLYIRQSMALRHISTIVGQKSLKRFLQKFRFRSSQAPFQPKDFIEAIGELPSPFSSLKRDRLRQTMITWWTKSGWPDYAVEQISASQLSDGKWLVDVEINATDDYRFPVEVDIEDEAGLHKRVIAKPSKASSDQPLRATTITQLEPKHLTIDPDRHIYDRDRFNNTDKILQFEYFPGSAKTIKDDHYTMVWFPFLQRRPGEQFSVGIDSTLLRYIQGELSFRVESQFDGKSGFQIVKKDKFPDFGLGTEFFVSQNFESYRESKFVLKRSPLFTSYRNIALSLKLRERRIAGQDNSAHGTFGISTTINSDFQNQLCQSMLIAEYEKAPSSWSPNFTYTRQTSSVQLFCPFLKDFAFNSRIFLGRLFTDDEVTTNVLFRPENLGEARIRLSNGGIPRPKEILSVSNDLYLPFIIPLPQGTMIINKQLKWRLFYDYGQSRQDESTFHAGGLGFLMPFGGDFVGSGTLALTRISLLTILYSKSGDEVSRKPSVLFDLTGEL